MYTEALPATELSPELKVGCALLCCSLLLPLLPCPRLKSAGSPQRRTCCAIAPSAISSWASHNQPSQTPKLRSPQCLSSPRRTTERLRRLSPAPLSCRSAMLVRFPPSYTYVLPVQIMLYLCSDHALRILPMLCLCSSHALPILPKLYLYYPCSTQTPYALPMLSELYPYYQCHTHV